jgi:hypothetical protein
MGDLGVQNYAMVINGQPNICKSEVPAICIALYIPTWQNKTLHLSFITLSSLSIDCNHSKRCLSFRAKCFPGPDDNSPVQGGIKISLRGKFTKNFA